MIKSFKLKINGIDVSSKVSLISYSIREVQNSRNNSIEKRVDISIIFSDEPIENIFSLSDFDYELEINGIRIDNSQYLKEFVMSNNYTQLILRKI